MKLFFEGKKRRVEDNINQATKYAGLSDEELFTLAEFDPDAGEKTGYSNYSYWRSTFRAFLHNRLALFMLIILTLLVLFTFVQPLLPDQYDPLKVQTNPLNNRKINPARAPSTTTVYLSVPAGTMLYA